MCMRVQVMSSDRQTKPDQRPVDGDDLLHLYFFAFFRELKGAVSVRIRRGNKLIS